MSRTYVSKAIRVLVAQAARHRCGYCLTQEFVVGVPMEIDHILPEALGGTTEAENLWLSCSLCNDHKGDRVAGADPETGSVVRLFNPRQQLWKEHFTWSTEGDRVLGRTPTGRATVVALQLNRASLMRSRRAWVAVGWHPPGDL